MKPTGFTRGTVDAMGTQRAIAEKIVKNGGDYILSVKGNHGRLHDETRDRNSAANQYLRKFYRDGWSMKD